MVSTARQRAARRDPAAGDLFDRPVFARARRLCVALPEVVETRAWGHPNFRAGRVTFCAFETIGGRPSLAFKLPAAAVARLLAGSALFATPYGRGRWTSVWVDAAVDWKAIAELTKESYRAVATTRLLNLLDGVGARRPR